MLACTLALTACGSDTEPTNPTPTPTPSPTPNPNALTYAPCPAASRLGGFSLELGDGFTAIEGRITDAVVPANILGISQTSGLCKLGEGRNLFCDPSCGASQTCGENGVCIPFPTAQDVGTVAVTGLTTALSMTPSAVNFYSNGAVTIPHPGFARGTAIALTASGGALPGFALRGRGVEALALSNDELVIERDRALTVRWATTSTTPDGPTRLRFVLDLAHHGGITASIDCDGVPDSGSFEIPATLINALLDIGVAGFPTLSVTRRTADSATLVAGCVDLSVAAKAVVGVTIPGLTSCAEDMDCPNGQTCQTDLSCR